MGQTAGTRASDNIIPPYQDNLFVYGSISTTSTGAAFPSGLDGQLVTVYSWGDDAWFVTKVDAQPTVDKTATGVRTGNLCVPVCNRGWSQFRLPANVRSERIYWAAQADSGTTKLVFWPSSTKEPG